MTHDTSTPEPPEALEIETEARIENNIRDIETLFREREVDTRGQLEMLGTTLVPLEEIAVQRMASHRSTLEQRLMNLPEQKEYLIRIIRDRKITEPIDREFIEAMVFSYNLHAATPTGGIEHTDSSTEDHFVAQAVERLRDRRAHRESEALMEHVIDTPVSANRTMRITLNEDGKRGRIRFSPMVDFTKQEIQLGPDAVDKILGGKLTAEDYEAIANTLLNTEGKFGEAARNYAEACFRWAEKVDDNQPADRELQDRRVAAQEFRRVLGVFDRGDIMNGPLSDIAFHSIYYTICKRFPSVSPKEIPQPFES